MAGNKAIVPTMAASIATLLVSSGTLLAADAFDMRDCPLERVTFVEPWTGKEFVVQDVRYSATWYCDNGMQDTEPKPDETCGGPYGATALTGRIDEVGGVTLVWSVIKGAPCCTWNAYLKSDPELTEVLSGTAPPSGRSLTLRSQGIDMIEFDEYSYVSDALVDKFDKFVPLVCRAGR